MFVIKRFLPKSIIIFPITNNALFVRSFCIPKISNIKNNDDKKILENKDNSKIMLSLINKKITCSYQVLKNKLDKLDKLDKEVLKKSDLDNIL